MSDLRSDADDGVRKHAKECFERTLNLVRATGMREDDHSMGDTLAFVHDWMRTAREIAESVFGSAASPDVVLSVYRCIADEWHYRNRRGASDE